MCGIAGVLRWEAENPAVLRAEVTDMAGILRHRGPDDEGEWVDPSGRAALAFRRLSILDLSPTGSQPMTSTSGRYVMVFNGEIYSFREIRQELEKEGVAFRGTSDSEVILAGIDRWGLERTLPKMNGMFAIALWDRENAELTLVRDRLGIKPLYVAETSHGLAFASELGALTKAHGLDKRLDPEAVLAYLTYLYVPAPRTPLRDVHKLEPGHFVRIRSGQRDRMIPSSTPYWSLETVRGGTEGSRVGPGSAEEAVDALESLLTDAVQRRMIADVPIGGLLSGGIDSSVVVALMQAHSGQPVKTFTIGFDRPEHDESSHAQAISRFLGTDHTGLMVSDRDALEVVASLPEIFDEPLADPSQIPTYIVSQLARSSVTVALSGDGGDELFAGYNRYVDGLGVIAGLARAPVALRGWLAPLVRAIPRSAWSGVERMRGGSGKTRLLAQKAEKLARLLDVSSQGEMYRTLLSTCHEPSRFMPDVTPGWDPVRDGLPGRGKQLTLGDMQEIDQRIYLPDDLLQKVDRASMAASLEARVPILDHRVVEFSWTLPDDLKIRSGEGKWLLRQVLYRHVPRELLERPKTGFSVPVADWLRGALRERAEHYLLDESPMRDAMFSRQAISNAWRRLLAGHDEEALGLWAIIVFESWRARWEIEAF